MPAAPKHRTAIVQAAVSLFRRNGYNGSGLVEISARSGAPKGSIYHYFPGGKPAIAEAAVRSAGEVVRRTLSGLDAETANASGLVRAYANRLAGWVAQSGWRDGCPITTTLLETAATDEPVRLAGAEAFADWIAVLSGALERQGVQAARAERLARVAICAIEGALILSRVEKNADAILAAGEEMADLFERG